MNEAEKIVADFPDYGISEDHKRSLVAAILAYGEAVRDEQREADAQIVESFAADIHMEMTGGAEIAAAIRAAAVKGER
jgi:hypothetical protein